MASIADFVALPDLDKLILLELQPAIQLNAEIWAQYADPNRDVWYRGISAGEVVKVEEDGVEYDEEFSISDCNGNASSFYFDDLNKILYVHTSGSDDPTTIVTGDPKYCLVAFFWKGFANKPKNVERFDQLLVNNIFNFWTTATNAEEWVEHSAGGTSSVDRDTAVCDDVIHLYSCKLTIDGAANQAYILEAFTTKPQRKCKIKILYKTNAGETARLFLRDSTSTDYLNSSLQWQAGSASCLTLAASTDWTWVEIEFVSHPTFSDYQIYIDSVDANAEIWIQEVDFYRYRQPVHYKALLPSALPSINQSVGTYIFPESQISIGDMTIINDGWYWDLRPGDKYLWHNKRMICKGGSDSWDYEDLPIFFYGLMREPRATAGSISLSGYDDRLNLKTIPTNRFDSTNYANCEDNWKEKPIPILIGGVGSGHIIKPPEIDTTIFKYKITDTFGATYPIHAISNVWKDGALLTGGGVDYTADLNNGEFTLTGDPGADEITCNAQSLKGISPFDAGLSMYPAEFLYFITVILNGIDKHRLNMASFFDLFTNRKLGAQEYIYTDTDSIDIINRLQTTAIFQLFTRLDGTIEARRYRSDVPSDVLKLYTRDFIDWEIVDDTNHTYRELVIQNKPNFATGVREEQYEDSTGVTLDFDADKIEWEHNIKDRLVLETNLETDLQTNSLFKNYMNFLEDPIKILKGTVKNHGALMLNPTDKIKVTLKANYDGTEKTIYDDETFQIYHLQKNLNTGNTYFEAFIGWGQLFWTIT